MSSVHKLPSGPWRATIETAFYANSVRKTSMAELYRLATKQPEVIVTSEPMYRPKLFGLPKEAKVLVSQDGKVVGRTARARRLVRQMGKNTDKYLGILREAVYQFNRRQGLWLEGIVGIHPSFMLKAHLLSPVTDAKNMLDWGFNFTPWMKPWINSYKRSRPIDEPDILVFADPEWSHPEFPDGLVLVDETENCIAILGMRYFGERKKGTLTLAWTAGVRHNMVACHGGIKKIGNHPPIAVFGLSGSGKSSITNSHDHEGTLKKSEKVTVIHDDAFLIDLNNNISVALEPSLFDKTDAVKYKDPQIKYFFTAQNVAVTKEPDGSRRLVAYDVRNRNGRCIKSRDLFNHTDSCEIPGIVIWLQKDPSLPPVSRVKTVELAVAMGASLSTMRAKGVENVDPEELSKLVVEPFANPFRVHPLITDCRQFAKLFQMGTVCYIMNTYAFGTPGKLIDIPKELSLKIVTELVRGTISWQDWQHFPGLQIPRNAQELFGTDYNKKYKPKGAKPYLQYLRDRLRDRITFLKAKHDVEHDMDTMYIAPLQKALRSIEKKLN